MSKKIEQLDDTIDKLKFTLFYKHRDELKAIMAIYGEKKEQKEKREMEIDEECLELERKLKSREIDHKQYKMQNNQLKKEKEDNDHLLWKYYHDALEHLFPNLQCIDIDDVKKFCEDPRSVGPLQP